MKHLHPRPKYADLLSEKDPNKSYTKFDVTIYNQNSRLVGLYKNGYADGLDFTPGRNVLISILSSEERAAYVHGFFTGDYEARNLSDN